MLEEIVVHNLGIIREATLPLGPGLTVLTGETGAGKTMVLSALNLLLGRRATASMVARGSEQLLVEGCWRLGDDSPLGAIEATGATVEDGELLISRTVGSEGRSRASLGGRRMPAATLQDIGSQLVSIHGQSDQVRLRSPQAQRESLDRFGGPTLASALAAHGVAWRTWKAKADQVEDIRTNSGRRHREMASLEHFVGEMDRADPQPGEMGDLQATIDRLSNLDQVRDGLSRASTLLEPEDWEATSPATVLGELVRVLEPLAGEGSTWEPLLTQANALQDGLDDLSRAISGHLDTLDGDSLENLYTAQERQAELGALVKRYGARDLEDLVTRWQQARVELGTLREGDVPLGDLEEELATLATALGTTGTTLTQERTRAGESLAQAVNLELAGLAMGDSTFTVGLTPATPGPQGADSITFLLAHPGQEPAPIARIASGGELSRIMLALEVTVTSGHGTLVFDEVDSGVGGETAMEIGRRLARLAEKVQVIVVTHLPQVAAQAQNHLRVSKRRVDGGVEATVTQLDPPGRIAEITRMLSGLSGSESGQLHAAELLAMAGN